MAMVATTTSNPYNPIAPHHPGIAWWVVSILVIMAVVIIVTAIVWLIGSRKANHQ